MLKNLPAILSIAILATGCSTVRPSASRQAPSATTEVSTTTTGGSVQFIKGISIKPEGHQDKSGGTLNGGYMNAPASGSATAGSGNVEAYTGLKFKYAILEDASIEELNNEKLLAFMDDWYGVPYHYGGTTKSGIDCSAFAYTLMAAVYGISALPRTSKEQYGATRRIRREDLQEGDLVFFHTLGRHKAVTHVGVYLRNNKFIHASISGVMISDMNDGYYDKHFVGAGRILDQQQVAAH